MNKKFLNLILSSLVFGFSADVLAAAQLTCLAEDGSRLQASISDDNQLKDIRIRIREGAWQSFPEASAALLDVQKVKHTEKVKSVVIVDGKGAILLAFASNALVDSSGTYSASCEISF